MVAYAYGRIHYTRVETPIDTMRGCAILLLVSYHVIGAGPAGGLKIGYPDPLRLFADFFIDLRMPLFAFIAGYVYAVRPPERGQVRAFLQGKARRLFVPLVTATMLFAVAASAIDNEFARTLIQMWQLPFVSYSHFWFVQAILVIFVVFGCFDAVVRHRYSATILCVACAATLTGFAFETSVLSVNGALYLFPYFMLGVVVNRHAEVLFMDARRISVLLLLLLVICSAWNLAVLFDMGHFSLLRRDLHSLGFGCAACVLVFLYAPRIRILEKLSPFGYTIYLYHIFGTVAAREACDLLSVTSVELRVALGVLGGVCLPVMLHEVARRLPISGLLLGKSCTPATQTVVTAGVTRLS